MTGKQVLFILIFTFITVIIWVTLDIIQSRANIAPTPEVQQLLEPISPNFDTSGLK
ncbi:MAG: hypothetical protein Q7R97_00395 [Candidatus Daviesbacteria bacterium]|nr:hypothetical protein [Candidatus Daviesbacteria bacterium]